METYSNDSIIRRLAVSESLSLEDAERHFYGLLQFLTLAASSDESLVPSKPIDEAWHVFLLHSEVYATYCHNYLGRFIHHRPTREPESRTDYRTRYSRTIELARRQFGEELDSEVWVDPEHTVCQTADCGGGGCASMCRMKR